MDQDFVVKGVLGIITALSVVVTTLFGWLMRSKDNLIVQLNSKIELQEQQRIDDRKATQQREDDLRAEYESKIDSARQTRSTEMRRHSRTIRMAQEAIALASEAPPRPAKKPARYTDDDAEMSTGVHDVMGEATSDQIARELERLRREKQLRDIKDLHKTDEEIDQELQKFLSPSSQPPPAKPPGYRGKLPSRRR